MMRRLPSAMCLCGIILTLSASCSIKEDRSRCPCLLVMDLEEIDVERFHRLAVRVEASGGYLFHDFIPGNPFPSVFTLDVPRGEVSVDILSEEGNEVFSGTTAGIQDGELYMVPANSECPPVYMQTELVSAVADSLHIPVRIMKSYCKVSVSMKAEGPYDFDIVAVGNVGGYDVTGSPVPGDFRYVMNLGSDGKCTVNVPRQTDASLRLLIVDDKGVLREFALGGYLAALGYDWSKDELDDVDILIDYTRTVITVSVKEWDMTFDFDLTL